MSAVKKNNGRDPVPSRRLILLAEDHPLNQKVALLLLERMGFDAHVVSNGEQAVNAVKRVRYDAILMDCHMPDVDGFEATRRIRQWESGGDRHIPIIAVTALAMAGDRERCLSAGMDDYVTKPIDKDLLEKKLVYWMNPGLAGGLNDSAKVVQIFDTAFATSPEAANEPINLPQLLDSYDDEAFELLRLFAHSSGRLVGKLSEALATDDCATVARLAHELKGASWAVGADEMARLAVFLEQAACQENWRLVHRTFVRLEHHFGDVKRYVQRQLEGRLADESTELAPVDAAALESSVDSGPASGLSW